MFVSRYISLRIFLCVALFAVGCTSNSTTKATQDSQLLDTEATLQETLDTFVSNKKGGVAVRLQRDNESFALATGNANKNGDELTFDQQFYVGSISKTFVATAVLQLVDEDIIDLDERLNTYLSEAELGGSITIRQLLSHESGIESYTDVPSFLADALENREKRFTQDEILSYVEEPSITAPAKPTFAYSNTNYILLGQMLEEVEGTDINSVIKKRITQPLGMTQTFFATADATSDTIAAGWSLLGPLQGDPDAEYASVESSAWAAGSLVSTTQDLATFVKALFGGELLSADQLDEMTAAGEDGNGLGIFSIDLSPTQQAFSHSGAIPGYTSTMIYDPNSNDYLIVLTNNDFLVADELAADLAEKW